MKYYVYGGALIGVFIFIMIQLRDRQFVLCVNICGYLLVLSKCSLKFAKRTRSRYVNANCGWLNPLLLIKDGQVVRARMFEKWVFLQNRSNV